MPSAINITFNCQQCGKKFSAPASAAGKTVTCSCGAAVMIAAAPTGQPFVTPTAAPQPVPPMASPATFPNMPTPQPFPRSPSGNYSASGLASRRTFPALDAAAKVFTILAWIYVVLGTLGVLVLLLAAAASGEPEAIGAGIGGCIGLALVVVLAFIFIRAAAELIRLMLYIAELLEDIRAK